MSPLTIIRGARDLLRPGYWLCGMIACDAAGDELTDAKNPSAHMFCLLGALRRAASGATDAQRGAAIQFLAEIIRVRFPESAAHAREKVALHGGDENTEIIISFNDWRERSEHQIHEFLDEALRLAEAA